MNRYVRLVIWGLLLLTLVVFVSVGQRSQGQSTAQIGSGSPLPVFVTNTPPLPEEFVPGSRWRFTTWTVPTVLTWTASVNKTSGPWAQLTVTNESGQVSTGWYYIPGMPGNWQKQ